MINQARTKKFKNLALLGIAFSIILCVIGIFLTITASRQLATAEEKIKTAEAFLSTLRDMETAYRGYVIVGTDEFLEPYQIANAAYPDIRRDLLKKTSSDPEDQQLTEQILVQADEKWLFSERVISVRSVGDARLASQMIADGQGKATMDEIRKKISLLEAKTYSAIHGSYKYRLDTGFVLFIVSILILVLASLCFIWLEKKSNDAYVKSNALLVDALQRTPIGLALISQDFKFVRANRVIKKIMEDFWHRKDIIGDVLPDSLIEALRDDVKSVHVENGQSDTSRVKIHEAVLADNDIHYIQSEVFALDKKIGADESAFGLQLMDITHQRRWEKDLEQARDDADAANRAKSAFLANMSHELRTPLTAVLGYCELIEDDLIDIGHDSVISDLRKIKLNANHLLRLINDVLDLSKIEAQRMEVHAVDFDLLEFLEQIKVMVAPLLMSNDNQFVVSLADGLPVSLRNDDMKLKQIIFNLIGNAAKFTSKGKITLAVSSTQKDGRSFLNFDISDTGIGMTPGQIEHLFQRFRQADETTTRKFGGTGLGLSLTRALSEILGGEISVQSNFGKGTSFTVSVPESYKPLLGPEEELVLEKTFDPATISNGLILIIDDELTAREYLKRILRKENFRTAEAARGAEGIKKAEELQPDVIMLDVMIPDLDGWHVLRSLQQNPKTRHIPVIMATISEGEKFAASLGASQFLKKPIKRNKLVAVLSEVIRGKSQGTAMIVDDDRDAIDRLSQLLRKDGWLIVSAENGVAALELLNTCQPDLLLIDLLMPEMDGFQLIQRVRAQAQLRNIPIVVVTALDVSEGRVRALQETTEDIVQKGSLPISELVSGLKKYMKNATPDA